MKLLALRSLPLLCVATWLAACSPQGDQNAAPAAPQSAQQAEAAQKLDTYRQLLRIKNDEMAVTMGHLILDRYPGSAAAREVEQTLPPIEKRWKENSEKNRLARLWLYQVSPMEGGTQSTAVIYSSKPSGRDRVRLVLRRHTDWGQNVFLYGSGHGFVCHGTCNLAATFDGKPATVKAFSPPSGEPALMISDDKGFIAKLKESSKITLEVTPADSGRKETLVYEVGGFDPAQWRPLPSAKKTGHKHG